MIRLIAAHAVDFIHSNILRHWPYDKACVWVVEFWPEAGCQKCWFCRWCGWDDSKEIH